MMEDDKVKNYFKSNNTVFNWWDPTNSDYKHIFEEEINIIENYLNKNLYLVKKFKILEISYGRGRLANRLSKYYKNYLGVDISLDMKNFCEKLNLDNAKFVMGDSENLPVYKEKFDLVICLQSLVHYPNPSIAISEMSRVLKNKGIIIISYDNKFSLRRIIKDFINRYYEKNSKNFERLGNRIFKLYSKKEIKKFISDNKLKIKEEIKLGFISPIRYQTPEGQNKYIISNKVFLKLRMISKFVDKIPFLNNLSTYSILVLEKK